ncbi:MAG: hypothetical protein AAB535_02855 [Patescibacteria group bacterium]
MTGLTQVAITTRKTIRYGIFFIIFLTVGRIVLGASINIYKRLFPSPPPPATVKFGKLSKLDFPESPKINLTYVLETPEGDFPKLTSQSKVYFMPKINPNLLSLDVARQKAKSLGFPGEPQQISETIYKFASPSLPSLLEINIITGIFSISYDLSADRTPLDKKPPAGQIGTSIIRSYLSGADILPNDLTGPTEPEFLKLDGGKFASALSLSESDVVKVNFFRKNHDDLASLTASPLESNVWFIVTGSTNKGQQIIAGEFHYYPIDESQFSTYPIKTPQKAFEELQSGQSFIANQGLVKDGETLKIRRIYLAYYDSESPSEFYQPIYVFEGDKGFMAYIPAVTSDYYGE